jgi:hypothetical protein
MKENPRPLFRAGCANVDATPQSRTFARSKMERAPKVREVGDRAPRALRDRSARARSGSIRLRGNEVRGFTGHIMLASLMPALFFSFNVRMRYPRTGPPAADRLNDNLRGPSSGSSNPWRLQPTRASQERKTKHPCDALAILKRAQFISSWIASQVSRAGMETTLELCPPRPRHDADRVIINCSFVSEPRTHATREAVSCRTAAARR